jgi:tetratricopeptide (TPR) repeat protein
VVGTSGSGKSSLVRSGLIPALQSGFMVGAGSSWRIATLRPGEDPTGNLALALDAPPMLGGHPDLAGTSHVVLEVTLRRSTLGLVDAVRQARLPATDNVLVIVDQFEELFRFRQNRQVANSRDEALTFVKLLLQATEQREVPLYVVLTMRSDFIGDCMNFPGLPEAVNTGLYLVGRMSRDSLRSAITGPVAVAGGRITPRLVNRVLNDLGDDHDQLPLVQHALMRMWDQWAARQSSGPLDIADYEAVGTFRDALSRHAEEAYQDAVTIGHGEAAERIFKALTDTFTDSRGVRRPTDVAELAAICRASEADIVRVVEIFRAPRHSFLMPPATVPLSGRSIVDLSHESLMRCWERLITWAEEERAAAAFYVRLSQAAAWFDEGSAGVWRNPELELAARWRLDNEPTPAWAERYAAGFERANAFLDRSLAEHERASEAVERERRATLRRTQIAAGVMATCLVAAGGFGWFAWTERQRAQANLALARQAVDESLAAADRDPALVGAEVPQVEELRRELLARAERFYIAFMNQEPRSEQARRDLAMAHLRLARINRMLEKRDEAEREYQRAIDALAALAGGSNQPDDRQALGSAFNALGETLRLQVGRTSEAAAAYDRALQVQQALVKELPGEPAYQEDLALTLSNRAILRSESREGTAAAEADFRESIRLLDPLSGERPRALQDRGRAANNLAAVLEEAGAEEAAAFYQRAVAGHERLVQRYPQNREYQLELAKFCNNLAMYLNERGSTEEASRRSRQAVDLLTELARPAPSLAIERADAQSLRGVILQVERGADAAQAFENALDLFAEIESSPAVLRMPAFHLRYGDLLMNLSALVKEPQTAAAGRRLLSRALDQYAGVATAIAAGSNPSQAQAVIDTLERVLPELPEQDRSRASDLLEQTRRAVGGRGPR